MVFVKRFPFLLNNDNGGGGGEVVIMTFNRQGG